MLGPDPDGSGLPASPRGGEEPGGQEAKRSGRGHQLERVAVHPIANRGAALQARGIVEHPVDAAVDAAHAGIVRGLQETGVLAGAAVARHRETEVVGSKEPREECRRGGAEGAVTARVGLMVRRGEQGLPGGIRHGQFVAVG